MADIPLKDYVDTAAAGLFRLGVTVTVGLLVLFFVGDFKNSKAVGLALRGAEEATKVALDAAEAKGVQHNGLIDRMREMQATFVTKGNVMSFLVALGICTTIYFTFLRGGA
jgi:hypothetical protein